METDFYIMNVHMSTSVLHLDLHTIAHNSAAIDAALNELFDEATRRRVTQAEIIPGKGGGQLMKRVQRWLRQPAQKARYKRVQVDAKNNGRLFVYFR